MKTTKNIGAAEKMAYITGGAALTLYVVFGLMYTSLIGGVIGLNVAGALMGFPVHAGLVTSAIMGLGVLGTVFAAALITTTIGAGIGWCAGALYDTTVHAVHDKMHEVHKGNIAIHH